jgi:O-antigen ligase
LRVAHNSYLEIATGTGVIGLVSFLGILASAIILVLKYSQKKYMEASSDLAIISTGLFAALGGYYLGMLFGSRQYEKTFWFLLALPIILQIIIIAKEKRSSNSEQILRPAQASNKTITK